MITLTARQLRGIVRSALKGLPGDSEVLLRRPLAHETYDDADIVVELADDLELWVAPWNVSGAVPMEPKP